MTIPFEEKSKTQIKIEANELQKLGEKLILLTNEQLSAIDIPKELTEAIIQVKTINSNKAQRRQKQYIGALMRKIDIEPVTKALKKIEVGISLKNKSTSKINTWHEQLINGEDSPFEQILAEFPDTNRQKLHQLVRNCRKEKISAKSQKSAKNLLKYLKEISG